MEILKGTLKNGFEYEIDVNRFQDDYEFFELLASIEIDKNYFAAIKVMNIVFGEEQKNRLVEYLKAKDKEKKARLTEIVGSLGEIFEKLEDIKEIKN